MNGFVGWALPTAVATMVGDAHPTLGGGNKTIGLCALRVELAGSRKNTSLSVSRGACPAPWRAA